MSHDVDAVADALCARLRPELEAMVARAVAGGTAVEIVTIDGLCDAIKVSAATVRRMVREGMPVEWAASAMRFDVAECRSWMRARGKKSVTKAGKRRPVLDGPVPGVTLKSRAR